MSKHLRVLTTIGRPLIQCSFTAQSHIPFCCKHSLSGLSGQIRLQPVRFAKPPLRRRLVKAAKITTLSIVLLAVTIWWFDLLEDEEEEEDAKNGKTTISVKIVQKTPAAEPSGEVVEKGEEDEDEVDIPEEMPEDAIFIPLGFTHQRPREYYKGSDPEWQSFIEFRKDREREKAVRKELATLVGSYFSGMKAMQKGLGTPVKVKQFWIDVIVPDGPPPEYERRGLEIADDYIALTTRPVSQLQESRFQAAILPLPVLKSFWASLSTSMSLSIAKAKNYLKLDADSENSDPSIPNSITSLDQLHDKENTQKQQPQSPARMNKMSDPKSTEEPTPTKESPKVPRDDMFPDRSKILSSVPTIQSISGDNGAAMTAFKRTLARTWKPPQEHGERGTLFITGLVQLEGPRGICVVDAAAWYHPREARYTQIACGVRNFRPRHQRPRGGP